MRKMLPMNGINKSSLSGKQYATLAGASAVLLWLSQPPFAIWPLATIALLPWLWIVVELKAPTRREYLTLWLFASLYWLVSLQGLRHANPLLYPCWIALAGYLGVYAVAFVPCTRQLLARGMPVWIAAPIAWVGLECVRNYLLSGISAAMLGHTMADVPMLIQIADLFGTYGISFVLVCVNVAVLEGLRCCGKKTAWPKAIPSFVSAFVLVAGVIGYGTLRLAHDAGEPLATFALIQRGEEVEYMQTREREEEIFTNYADQARRTLQSADKPVDAVVWPESMFTGGVPRMTADPDAVVPTEAGMPASEFFSNVELHGQYYLDRIRRVQSLAAMSQRTDTPPHLIVGCGVVHYDSKGTNVYSGAIHATSDGRIDDWYGKTHLVMFGEYVPIVQSIPGASSLLPPGMGLARGPGVKRFMVGETAVVPNICIETAVERVTINQIAELGRRGESADVVVNLTNDGWFDETSVIEHHLRCAQLVAVGCRRPILSAANNGPTAWIDSSGRIQQRLATGVNGAIIARPRRDDRHSLYVRIGDWPARVLGLIAVLAIFVPLIARWTVGAKRSDEEAADSPTIPATE